MEKKAKIKLLLLILFIIFISISSISSASDHPDLESKKEVRETKYILNKKGIIKSEIAKKIIKDKAAEVIQAISNKNFNKLAAYVHPENGLRFTPYTYVRVEKDVVFKRKQVKNFFEDNKKYLWGHYNGSGEEIRLTPAEYYQEFIYSEDFIEAEKVGYNEVLSIGNMLENQFEVYNNPIIVEYYYPGFKPKYEGMDWKSLRLVFVEYQNDWKLRGIIHNQWTI